MNAIFQTVLLLIGSNIFMIVAWYGHLKFASAATPLVIVILGAWMIALPEYVMQVPANRIGSSYFGGPFTTPQLKIIAEAINLVVFTVFSLAVLKEKMRGTDYVALGLVMAAVVVSALGGRLEKGGHAARDNQSATTATASEPAE